MLIKSLKNFTELSGWRFFVEEGNLNGARELTGRRLEVDLEGLKRLDRSDAFTTQVHAYVSFTCLDAIHSRIDQIIAKKYPKAAEKPFNVHASKTFVGAFTPLWKPELVALLASIEAWASSLDVNECISAFVRNCPDGGRVCLDGPSVTQINHLAALAFVGNFSELEEYSAAFKRGARMNFGPLITLEIIEAVLDISYDQFANK
jgi:hypothetical protein